VQLLLDGPATYHAMLSAIAGAQDHVNMETYIMDDDDVGQNFAKVLMDKQMQGVQINLIRDSVGTFSTPPEFFRALTDKGIKVIEFNPVNPLVARNGWSPNRRDHRKLLIVDGSKAFLGGINISSVYSGGSFGKAARNRKDGTLAWRDTDLQLEGPVVGELQKLFLGTWEKQNGGPLPDKNYFPQAKRAGQTVVRAIGSTPDEPYSQIYAALLSAIGNAETSVYLTNAYFAPDPQLLAALKAAVGRGVDVKLILPSQTDSWLVFHAGRGYYTSLLKSGIKIFQLRGAILHSKTALIDGVWATVGSTNLDWRSFLHNQELDAVVLGAEFGSQVQAMFDRDLAESDEILLAQWQRRTLDLRFKEFFARIWEYWL
jgi:cardiolipin synthase A/B